MNINNWSGKKKIAALLIALLIIVGLVVTVYLVQRQQENRSHAQRATKLILVPDSPSVAINKNATISVNIDPGVNQVSAVKLVINFDPAKFDSTSTTFTPNSNSKLQMVGSPVVTDGKIVINFDIGSNPTQVVSTAQTLGTLSLKAGTVAGATQITFDETNTQVRSLASTDGTVENVLLTTTPATITIQAQCQPNVSTCSWDPVDGASSYNYVITNTDTNTVLSHGTIAGTSVTFNSTPGVNYKCDVTASNSCGNTGEAGSGTGICTAPSSTPTPGVSSSPTPGVSESPTPGVSSSPTPTTPESSVTPTTPENVTVTPTPTTEIVASITPTPTPKLPPTGNTFVTGGIIGGFLILLGGLALLIL